MNIHDPLSSDSGFEIDLNDPEFKHVKLASLMDSGILKRKKSKAGDEEKEDIALNKEVNILADFISSDSESEK